MSDPAFATDQLAEARAAVEAAYARAIAYIPADSVERLRGLLRVNPSAARTRFHALCNLYAPLPDYGRLVDALKIYRATLRRLA